MQYTDAGFVILYTIFLPLYYAVPINKRKILIHLISFCFYLQFGIIHTILLYTFALSFYFFGIIIEKYKVMYKAYFVMFCLVFFLYKDNVLLKHIFSTKFDDGFFSLIFPVGFSFFMLQGISYLSYVKNGGVAERNISDLLLYITFFPCVISGPIQKSNWFLPQIKSRNTYDFKVRLVKKGLLQIIWGYFQKLVISNRLAIFVNALFDSADKSGICLWFGAVAYGIQIYIDFCGYSDIVIGISKTLGFSLERNFNYPYMARSVSDFWRRWHISLSNWLKDNIYIPLGGNRRGKLKKYLNVMVVFLVSGIWHGGGLSFIVWGMLHGLYQIGEGMTCGMRRRIRLLFRIEEDDIVLIWGQRLLVFVLVDFAWIFFRSSSLKAAINYIHRMFIFNTFSVLKIFSDLSYGLNMYDWIIVVISISFFLIGQTARRKIDCFSTIDSFSSIYKWGCYGFAFLYITFFGVYGSGGQVIPFNYFMF